MGQTRDRVDACRIRADRTGVTMDNKNILDIGSIISDINMGTASKFGRFFQERETNQGESLMQEEQLADNKDGEPIGDYAITYQELCDLLDNIKQKWSINDTNQNLYNPHYQRDLLYLYDRITLDMNYLNGYPDRNNEWLERLLELKYEIRNLL